MLKRNGLIIAYLLVTMVPMVRCQSTPLGPADLVALKDIGVPLVELVNTVTQRGLSFPMTPLWKKALLHRGVDAVAVEGIGKAATSFENNRVSCQRAFDPVTGCVLAIPNGWRMTTAKTGADLRRETRSTGMTSEVSVRLLPLTPKALEKSGLKTLNDLHDRRIQEIIANKTAGWKITAQWPLKTRDVTGIHAVMERDVQDGVQREIFCLTWFARKDAILSFSTHISGPQGHPRFGDVVDEVSLILTEHRRAVVPANGTKANHVPLHIQDGKLWFGNSTAGRLVGELPLMVERIDADAFEELALVWHRNVAGKLVPSVMDLTQGKLHEPAGEDIDWVGHGNWLPGKKTFCGLTKNSLGFLRVISVAMDGGGITRQGPQLAMGALIRGAVAMDDEDTVVAWIESDHKEKFVMRCVNLRLGELARIPVDKNASVHVNLTGREIHLFSDAWGQNVIPRNGGLPLHLPGLSTEESAQR